jgi:hypothetical protein
MRAECGNNSAQWTLDVLEQDRPATDNLQLTGSADWVPRTEVQLHLSKLAQMLMDSPGWNVNWPRSVLLGLVKEHVFDVLLHLLEDEILPPLRAPLHHSKDRIKAEVDWLLQHLRGEGNSSYRPCLADRSRTS